MLRSLTESSYLEERKCSKSKSNTTMVGTLSLENFQVTEYTNPKLMWLSVLNKKKVVGELLMELHYLPFYNTSIYNQFEQLLCTDFLLMDGLYYLLHLKKVPRKKEKSVATALIHIFNWNEKAVPLVEFAVKQEVENTTTSSILFRGSSLSHHLLRQFATIVDKGFAQRSLRSVMREYLSQDLDLEIDPNLVKNKKYSDANRKKLLEIAQKFLDAIIEAEPYIQQEFRKISALLQRECTKKFDDVKYKIVGGFLFLRWLCPTIVSPKAYGLTPAEPTPKQGRGLILIAKLLQNLSNEVLDDSKQSFMADLHSFTIQNIPKLHQFFDQVIAREPRVRAAKIENTIKNVHYLELIEKIFRTNSPYLLEYSEQISDPEKKRSYIQRLQQLEGVLERLQEDRNAKSKET